MADHLSRDQRYRDLRRGISAGRALQGQLESGLLGRIGYDQYVVGFP